MNVLLILRDDGCSLCFPLEFCAGNWRTAGQNSSPCACPTIYRCVDVTQQNDCNGYILPLYRSHHYLLFLGCLKNRFGNMAMSKIKQQKNKLLIKRNLKDMQSNPNEWPATNISPQCCPRVELPPNKENDHQPNASLIIHYKLLCYLANFAYLLILFSWGWCLNLSFNFVL